MKKDLQTILNHTKENNGCLEWQKCLNTDGYPRALIEGNANAKVHRIVWELYNLQSASGRVVRHTCDNPKCINPNHLIIGTNQDNIKDRDLRDRHGKAKLNHAQVKAIRELYQTKGYSQKELAYIFNVNPRTINSLVLGHHWQLVL